MDTPLKLTLFVGSLCGCFPVRSLHGKKYSSDYPIFFYCLLILVLYICAEVFFFLGQKQQISAQQPSQLIVNYLVQVTGTVTCLALRIWTLYRCSRIADLILQLIDLKKSTYHPAGSYIKRYYFLGYLILLIDFAPFVYHKLSGIVTPEYDVDYPTIAPWIKELVTTYKFLALLVTKYFALALIIDMGVHVLHIFENFCYELQNLYCHQAVSNVHMIDDDYDSDVQDEDEDDATSVKRLDKNLMKDKSLMADFAAGVFGTNWGISAKQNNNTSKTKVEVFQDNKMFWITNTSASMNSINEDKAVKFSLKDLSTRFLEIQKCFDEYNKVAGLHFFILLSNYSIELIHKFYGVASGSDIQNDQARIISKSVIAFLAIAGLSHLGELIQAKMRKWKEQLKCIMLTELLCEKFHDSTNTLTESVIKWDWSLSAMNLFNINHSTIPAIAGTMVTYLIVIIQLKVSESSTTPATTTVRP